MLKRLYIQNFVLIDMLDIDFEHGLSVITGETGAGKSILLEAINLGLGARADQSMIRPEADKAQIILEFCVKNDHPIYQKLDEFAILKEEGLLFKRILTKSGHSKAYLNDQPITLSKLKELGVDLIEIIGQFSTASLMQKSEHLCFLDQFAKLQHDKNQVEKAYHIWYETKQKFIEITQEKERIERDYDYLSAILQELNDIAPLHDEESLLIEKKAALSNAQKLNEIISKTISKLNEPKNVSALLSTAQRELMKAPLQNEDIISPIYQQLEKAAFEVEDAEAKLHDLLGKIGKEAKEVEAIEDRIYVLRHLARKHRVQPDALGEFWDNTREKIETFEKAEADLAEYAEKTKIAKEQYLILAQNLSQKRFEHIKILEQNIQKELIHLKLEKALFKVVHNQIETPQLSGIDQIHFAFAPNPGLPFTAIDETASGGEMSRLLLALKILDKSDHPKTLVFDEIDTGVGGAVSDALGLRLQSLSVLTQTIAITHAPQIAAKANHHYKVEKKTNAEKTASTLTLLDTEAHQEEIARMLSGAFITDEARRAALSLLQSGQIQPHEKLSKTS
ncbi:MAG: DNA repair protein RecN [Alphaproteobacteria bacterium]|nr:DNA repair protein RecN [Alphaproteobacteria bacterium]